MHDEWWRHAVIYQVYPRSFADSDGNGIGDLPGITAHLDYLAALGVDAIWLSPFYVSPQNDGGYDVVDYRAIDPLFGTLADADALIASAHDLGLRVIVDLVPNHTSSEHPWFKAALAAAPGSPERDLYMFREGKPSSMVSTSSTAEDTIPAVEPVETPDPHGAPPNNWKSIFGSTAWTRVVEADGAPGQWYLHLFDRTQPDLNWDNEKVRAEFDDVLRFWLKRGVDGFRVDVAHGLVKAKGLPDTKQKVAMLDGATDDTTPSVILRQGADATQSAESQQPEPEPEPQPMFDQDGVHEIYRRWRKVLDEFDPPGQHQTRCLVAEAWVWPPSRLAKYLRPDEMQQAFNFEFLTSKWDAANYRKVITSSLEANGAVGAPTTWVLSNHDVVRHASRFGLKDPGSRPNGIYAEDEQPDEELGLRRARAATLFMLALPGSAYLYQGEELGLPEHTALPDEVRQAPEFFRTEGKEAGRDGCRVPLPWKAGEPGFGFSPSGKTWLPQPADWAAHSVDTEEADPTSTLNFYRVALRLRKQLDLGNGTLTWLPGYPKEILAFRIEPSSCAKSQDPAQDSAAQLSSAQNNSVLVLANLGNKDVELPKHSTKLICSETLKGDKLPPDTTVWLQL